MCRHRWEGENWKGQIFCDKCGIVKAEFDSGRYKGQSKAKATPPTRLTSKAYTRHERWIKALLEKMIQEHGLTQYRIEFGGGQSTYYNHTEHKIHLGEAAVQHIGEGGFSEEYKTWRWIWGSQYRNNKGKRGLWSVALHEFAHALQGEDGAIRRGKGGHHNINWAQHVQDLQVLYPFSEVEWI